MKSGGRGMTSGRNHFSFQRLFLVTQIAISLVLLIGALLFVRTFRNLTTLDAGFRKTGILLAYLNFGSLQLSTDKSVAFQKNLLDQIKSIPEVESVASTTSTPLSGSSWTLGAKIPDAPDRREDSTKITYISPDYFKAMGTSLIDGRDFNNFGTKTSPKVAIVNETFVRRFFDKRNPIGAMIQTVGEPCYPDTRYQVIGLVKDTKYSDLRQEIQPITFVPAAQHPCPVPFIGVTIRSSASLSNLTVNVRNKIEELNPLIRMRFKVFEEQIREGLVRERLMAWLAGFFGALAAVLAMIGLYSVISYMVVKRRNEIGIRMALGAGQWRVILLILREMSILLLLGLGVGVSLSLIVTRSASALLLVSPRMMSSLSRLRPRLCR